MRRDVTFFTSFGIEAEQALGEAITSESTHEVRFHSIFIAPKHRGKGVGKILMKALLNGFEKKPVTLCTGFGNVPFFKQYNFEVTEASDSLAFMRRE